MVGVDWIIAKYNVTYTAEGKVDMQYLLHELSNDVFYVLDEKYIGESGYDKSTIYDEQSVGYMVEVTKEWQERSVSWVVNK
jgi:hypothetical protein